MHRVVVVASKKQRGCTNTESNWRVSPGQPGNTRSVRTSPVEPIMSALTKDWPTEALFTCYEAPGLMNMPRVNKSGLEAYIAATGVEPTASVLFADVDNTPHVLWDDTMRAAWHALWDSRPPSLRTCGVYWSPRGYRLVQTLATPIPVSRVEHTIRAWFAMLAADGISVDTSCADWTRLFRVPRHRAPFPLNRVVPEFEDYSRMTPINIEVVDSSPVVAPKKGFRARRTYKVPSFASDAPEGYQAAVKRLSSAVLASEGNWHELALALAGALLGEGMDPALVPAIVHASFLGTCADTRLDDRLVAAKSTVDRHASGEYVTGLYHLQEKWPMVAVAVQQIIAAPEGPSVVADAPTTKAGAYRAMVHAIETATSRVSLIGAECGLGKTEAAIEVAVRRAGKKPEASRAPTQSKTAISVDKHSLAKEIVERITAAGGTAKRVFGPLSLLDADGKPVCRLHDRAMHLQRGGQSIGRELCNGGGRVKCEHYDTCAARDGVEGPSNARIIVGPHQLLDNLVGEAGETGLVVIDEPPSLLETKSVSEREIYEAERASSYFAPDYWEGMRPFFAAFLNWYRERAEESKTYSLEELLETARFAIETDMLEDPSAPSADEALRMARQACEGRHAPPVVRSQMERARRDLRHAKDIGDASSVFALLDHALCPGSYLWVQDTARGKNVVCVGPNQQYSDALRRDGATVVTDANIALHVPGIAKTVGYEPELYSFAADDGAPIQRMWLEVRISKTKCFSHGKPMYSTAIGSAIQRVLLWAGDDRDLGIITYKSVADDIRAGRIPGFDRRTGKTLIMHYGATRGKNEMANVDCLATIGDPWPDILITENEAKYFGMEHPERRNMAYARAELEQAHGRLRAIHRKRPGRALHAGVVLPGGSGWAKADVIPLHVQGRIAQPLGMTPSEFASHVEAVGGAKPMAERLGCSLAAVYKYQSGERRIGAGVAEDVRQCISQCAE